MSKNRKSTAPGGTVRIIAGAHRGRRLPVPDVPGLRPTSDRVRETLFNWLMFRIRGKRVLDAFAGAGSLGFEAQSRGALEVTMLELNPAVCARLRAGAAALGCANVNVIATDARAFLRSRREPFDVIFLDPPFRTGLLEECLPLLTPAIAPAGTLLYLEHEKESAPVPPGRFRPLREMTAGQTACRLYEAGPGPAGGTA